MRTGLIRKRWKRHPRRSPNWKRDAKRLGRFGISYLLRLIRTKNSAGNLSCGKRARWKFMLSVCSEREEPRENQPRNNKHFHSTFCREYLSTCLSLHKLFSQRRRTPGRQHNCHTEKQQRFRWMSGMFFGGLWRGLVLLFPLKVFKLPLWSLFRSNLLWLQKLCGASKKILRD